MPAKKDEKPGINLVANLLRQRAERLEKDLENAEAIAHGTTVGDLREAAIKSSLRQLVPTGFDVC